MRLRFVSILASISLTVSLSGCLAGPGTALGGPIGIAPDNKAAEVLAEPDSTRGDSFVLISNRRDLLDATRLQLNAAARAYARLLGERPVAADVRLSSDRSNVSVALRVGRHTIPPFQLSLDPSARGGRAMEPVRVSMTVAQVVANEWLGAFVSATTTNANAPAANSWSQDARVPVWLRLGVLEAVAESPVHEVWLSQLGRNRESLPPLTTLFAGEGCDAECRRLVAPPSSDDPSSGRMALMIDEARRNSGSAIEGSTRFLASAYGLTLFFSRREGAPFLKTLIAAAVEGRPLESAFGTATSFTPAVADIDRQWRVWLASYAYGPGRQPPE